MLGPREALSEENVVDRYQFQSPRAAASWGASLTVIGKPDNLPHQSHLLSSNIAQ